MKQPRRSGLILGLLALGLLAGAALTAHPAQAVEAPGPYYAEPAWDRKLACPTIANCSRFVVLTNWNSAAVLDKETGLVWERSPDTTAHYTWAAARLACTAKTTGGRKGWRLPSIPELASLIDHSVAFPGPTLPPGHPFLGIVPTFYWSATTHADGPASAWYGAFNIGVVTFNFKAFSIPAWCVRGGMNADQY